MSITFVLIFWSLILWPHSSSSSVKSIKLLFLVIALASHYMLHLTVEYNVLSCLVFQINVLCYYSITEVHHSQNAGVLIKLDVWNLWFWGLSYFGFGDFGYVHKSNLTQESVFKANSPINPHSTMLCFVSQGNLWTQTDSLSDEIKVISTYKLCIYCTVVISGHSLRVPLK